MSMRKADADLADRDRAGGDMGSDAGMQRSHEAGAPPVVRLAFRSLLGLFWLATIPLTSSLVATFFGTSWMSMLFGFVFLSHQLGSFTGLWLAGRLYDATKSYDTMWWISIALALFAALVNWPIRERPVERLRTQTA